MTRKEGIVRNINSVRFRGLSLVVENQRAPDRVGCDPHTRNPLKEVLVFFFREISSHIAILSCHSPSSSTVAELQLNIYQRTESGGLEMAHQPVNLRSSTPWDSCGGRRESIPDSCLLASIYNLNTHTK